MPGTILSQLGMQISASNWCAPTMVSTLSAMISRLGRLYFMPKWPMAMPSSTPMVLNRNGTPPASRTASLTIWPNLSRCTWPGMMSTYEFAMAMKGLSKSSSFTPVARSRLRCGARSIPFLIASERMARPLKRSNVPSVFMIDSPVSG